MLGFKVDKMLTRLKELRELAGTEVKGENRLIVDQGCDHFANVIEVVLSAFQYDKIAMLHRKIIAAKFKKPEQKDDIFGD